MSRGRLHGACCSSRCAPHPSASLFNHPVAAWILYSSGNIPVDRKSKDRQKLFKGTFEALSKGKAVALFPEGTSYTEPRIMQVKDGAAWAALEYCKFKQDHPELVDQSDVKIVPAAIVYTNKSKYRSAVGLLSPLSPFHEDSFRHLGRLGVSIALAVRCECN